MKITRPLKGPQLLDPETNKFFVEVPYPALATPKFDGIRCLVIEHRALTDKFEPIPNKWIAYQIAEHCPNGFDGEIITYTEGMRDDFNMIQSKAMKTDGKPNFKYHVFDFVKSTLTAPYARRIQHLKDEPTVSFVSKVLPTYITNDGELFIYEAAMLSLGYEGIMLRMPYSPYKCGRSTLTEFFLVKMKRFLDSEAKVLAINERMHNSAEAKRGGIGQIKRRKIKADRMPTGMVGSFTVQDINPESSHFGQVFKCGVRLNNKQKKEIFEHPGKYIEQIMTYKYQERGEKELPRFPVFYRWRKI